MATLGKWRVGENLGRTCRLSVHGVFGEQPSVLGGTESGRMKPRTEARMEGWWGPEPRVLDSVGTEEPSGVLKQRGGISQHSFGCTKQTTKTDGLKPNAEFIVFYFCNSEGFRYSLIQGLKLYLQTLASFSLSSSLMISPAETVPAELPEQTLTGLAGVSCPSLGLSLWQGDEIL